MNIVNESCGTNEPLLGKPYKTIHFYDDGGFKVLKGGFVLLNTINKTYFKKENSNWEILYQKEDSYLLTFEEVGQLWGGN